MPIYVPTREPVEAIHGSAEMGRAEVRIALRHLEIGMPEELLHVLETRPPHDQMVAAVCRRSWNRKPLMPARSRALAKAERICPTPRRRAA